nr:protein kinase-like domain, phloem protein 2-like protein [Tanacetum cinerariifolium]
MSSRMDKLAHLKIPFESILSATDNFDNKNVIGSSEYEKRHKGQLSWSGELIAITARRFNKDSDEMFWTEVSMLSSLKHQNLVSLVGFCHENGEKIIITRAEIQGSLDNHLSDATLLTWVRRLKISVGLAHALSYIHYDGPRDFSIIHRDICSSLVLLNDNFKPKLSSFETSMKIEASQRHHSFPTSRLWSRNGYTDPTYEKTKSVNHKTDMYSFGIVLFELLCGRKAVIANDPNKYLAPAAILLYKQKKLNEIVDWDLWKQMDSQSFGMFAEIACDCLNDELSQRPNIDEIVPRLEKALELARENRLTGGMTHKSDVYSFGVLLFEVLCGRSAVLPGEKLGEGLLCKLVKSNLDDMIDPHLRKQMHPESLKIFSETAYCCVKEERADRPYIDQVVKRLEKAFELQWKHENPELSRNAIDGASSNRLKGKNLEHLKVPLNDIIHATNNFDETCCIGSGGFGKVYKADLEHFDSSKSSSIEGLNKCDLPRKRSMVAIKRIQNHEGEQGFISEIETLTTCKHDNIISLLGFCSEGNGAMILVYEHASKGSLDDYLGSSDKMTNLNWVQRLKICLDIAHGLNYIHTNTDQDKQKIIHRDIKSANILLDDNWKAKIADFGLSKFHPADQDASTFKASTIAGTNTYLDPEYEKTRR